ncbi:unnamed protein product [Ascophyllum nodosum]
MYRSSRAWIQPSFERIAMHKAKRVQYTWLMRKAVALVIGALTLLSDVGLAFTLPSRVALPATRASHVLYGWGTYGHFRRNQGRCFSSFLYESVACSHRRERHGYYERGRTSSTTVAAMPEKVAEGAGYILGPEVGRCEVEPLPPLRNKYYALRHGQSVANMEGIISSNPDVGAAKHGLTSNGRAQARAAATALIELVGRERLDSLVFISSGYLRARQTAEECRAALQNILSFERQVTWSGGQGDDAKVDETISVEGKDQTGWLERHGGYDVSPTLLIRPELRERFFGELDGTILVNYNKVWPEDVKDGKQTGYGVESVCEVAARIGGLVRSLEKEYEDACIVFSSHADTLQIAQCYVAGVDERLFSQYRFKNGEVRSLLQDPASLPPPNPMSFK